MKIGLFFGTFNPVHIGHMVIANYMAEFTDLDEVWMVVTPQNPFKTSADLLDDEHRLKMVELAVGDHKKIKVSQVEFDLPKPSYTIHTITSLKNNYPENDFVLIIGSDNLEIFKSWKNYELILAACELYVYPRLLANSSDLKNHPHVKIIDAPVMEISSTFIRKCIKDKKDVRFLLPENIVSYLSKHHFYE